MPAHKSVRPVYLNLFRIHLPVGGWLSIVHRITGVVLVLAMIPAGYLFQYSLASEDGYQLVQSWLSQPFFRALVLLLVWSLAQHLVSGVRHLLLDLDVGVQRQHARMTAVISFVASVILVAIYAGVWL